MPPLYEYRCTECGHENEKLEPMSAPEVQDCPECKKPNVFIRILQSFGFALTGSGWFKDGYSKGK